VPGLAGSPDALTAHDLIDGWHRMGISAGMDIIVHASLSSLGHVNGGAGAVVETLLDAVGPMGTLVVPTFTPNVADPDPDIRGVPDDAARLRRDAVPIFSEDLPSSMGAVPEALRCRADSIRSSHPQASVAAVGRRAARIVARQPLAFAVGPASPFGRLHDLKGHILLLGVGHNRNTFLHHAESLTATPRLKVRRFPSMVGEERVWIEVMDVGNDNDTLFPLIGQEYEKLSGTHTFSIGLAVCRLIPIRPLVTYATKRLGQLLP
jgi:aminoglycoside 3-N-acetyltransferase